MDSNVIAALGGAIVGSSIGFLGTAFLMRIDRCNEKKNIKAGIIAELENYKKELEGCIYQCGHLLEELKKDGHAFNSFIMNRGSDLVFVASCVDRIGIFNEKTTTNIIKLLNQHRVMEEMISWINGNAPKGLQFKNKSAVAVTKGLIDSSEKMVGYCDSIIKDLQNINTKLFLMF